MTIAGKTFDAIDEGDLRSLLTSGATEGLLLEYKREPYGNADADKKEFLKDLSSFANSAGGHLLIGVEETDGSATELKPITDRDADTELQRLESLLRDGIEPRLPAARLRAVPISSGGYVLVARIPQSWSAPHRVSIRGSNRFYGRTSAGAYELSVSELRTKFNSSADALDAAIAFHQRRVAQIGADEGTVPLAHEDGRLTAHIVPLQPTGAIDLERAYELNELLRPLGSDGWSPEFNFDGYANVRRGERSFGYTQVFRNGSIEATKVRLVAPREGVRRIPAVSFGQPIVDAIPRYLSALQQLEVPSPLAVMMTLEGVRGAYLGYSNSAWQEDTFEIRKDILEFPPVLIPEYSNNIAYVAALRPIFDSLWNAGGLSRSNYFDEQGRWTPPRS